MELKLKFTKNAGPFIEFLSSFKRLEDTLLLEFDVENARFSAKSLCGKGDIDTFRHSYLPFEACGVKVSVSDDTLTPNENGNLPIRVYHGLLNYLGKFISIITLADKLANYDEENSKSGLVIKMEYVNDTAIGLLDSDGPNGVPVPEKFNVLCSTKMTVATASSKCTVRSFKLDYFKTLSDKEFDELIHYVEPSSMLTFDIDELKLSTINRISDIYKSNISGKMSDFIVFNISDGCVSVSNLSIKDQKDNESGSVLVASDLDTSNYNGMSLEVSKDWFKKNITKGVWNVKIGVSPLSRIDRVCFDNVDEATQIVTKVTLSNYGE